MPVKKHITVVTGYFYPEDTAIGLYTTQFCDFLVDKGYDVTVLTGFPYYPAWKIHDSFQTLPSTHSSHERGMTIHRARQFVPTKVSFSGRIRLMVTYSMGIWRNLAKVDTCDLVICIVPLTLTIYPAKLLARKHKAKLWIHVQDFEFDLALESGILNSSNIAVKAVRSIVKSFERYMLNAADIVSSISFGMLQKTREKSRHQNPFYFPNWVSGSQINPETSSPHPLINPSRFTLLYSGNIGEKQDWQFLIDLCKLIDDPELEVLIVGDGGARKNLEAQLSPFNFVRFHPPLPYEDLNNLLCHADVHFLFQKTEILDSLMPSKILGMMASGKPSVVTGNAASEVAVNFSKSDGGAYFSDGKPETVLQQLLTWKNNRALAKTTGENARRFILSEFSDDAILTRFGQKINDLL